MDYFDDVFIFLLDKDSTVYRIFNGGPENSRRLAGVVDVTGVTWCSEGLEQHERE